MPRVLRLSASAFILAITLSSCGFTDGTSLIETGRNGELDGTFRIEQGICGVSGPVSGSWYRMVEPGGSIKDGPFVTNYDSICPDQVYSLLSPGSVGFRSGEFQEHPKPAFDAATNGLATEIFGPTKFYSVNFSVGTEEVSPITGETLDPPRFFATNDSLDSGSVERALTASLESLHVAWNGEIFEQGAPHPEGIVGGTTVPRGTINLETGRYLLEWTSQVQQGIFAGYTGVWHIEGTFVPRD